MCFSVREADNQNEDAERGLPLDADNKRKATLRKGAEKPHLLGNAEPMGFSAFFKLPSTKKEKCQTRTAPDGAEVRGCDTFLFLSAV